MFGIHCELFGIHCECLVHTLDCFLTSWISNCSIFPKTGIDEIFLFTLMLLYQSIIMDFSNIQSYSLYKSVPF